jgi:predicted ester cyclase
MDPGLGGPIVDGMKSARIVVERYLAEVLGGSQADAVDELIADAVLRRRVELFRTAFTDVAIKPNLVVTEGDVAGVTLSARGTHAGPFQGMPATGHRWSATCSAFYRIADGRIVDHWVNWDLLGILEQIGAVRRIDEVRQREEKP